MSEFRCDLTRQKAASPTHVSLSTVKTATREAKKRQAATRPSSVPVHECNCPGATGACQCGSEHSEAFRPSHIAATPRHSCGLLGDEGPVGATPPQHDLQQPHDDDATIVCDGKGGYRVDLRTWAGRSLRPRRLYPTTRGVSHFRLEGKMAGRLQEQTGWCPDPSGRTGVRRLPEGVGMPGLHSGTGVQRRPSGRC